MRKFFLTILAIGCSCALVRADIVVQSQHAVIISGHPEATRLGMEVLHNGGSAADALVTVSLALGVAEPGNSGVGGKIVLIYYDAKTHHVSAMVALGAAPLKLNVEKATALSADAKRRGWTSACTPGLLAGIYAAHEKWGTKPWPSLVAPAADLAERGFKLSELAAAMDAEFPMEIDPVAAKVYAPNGKHFRAGDLLKNPALAATLRLIADKGPSALYGGEIGERLIKAAQAGGSPMTMEDLTSYKPRFLSALSAHYHGYQVFSSPPPLSGGTTLLLAMKCLEKMAPPPLHPRDATYMDTVGRALQQVYPEVNRSAADIPDALQRTEKIFDPKNIDRLAKRALHADPRHPYDETTQTSARFEWSLDDGDQASTTHLIIVDAQGNIACATQSLGYHFGAAVMADGCGFLLNNDMNNFSYQSKSSINLIAPGKWPRSTMTPTIVLKNGSPILAIGSPAGQRIPGAVLQCTLDVLDAHEPLEKVIETPRFHVRRPSSFSEPANEMDLETEAPKELDAELSSKGWKTFRRPRSEFYFGAVNATEIFPDGKLLGVADQRRTGDAGGE